MLPETWYHLVSIYLLTNHSTPIQQDFERQIDNVMILKNLRAPVLRCVGSVRKKEVV